MFVKCLMILILVNWIVLYCFLVHHCSKIHHCQQSQLQHYFIASLLLLRLHFFIASASSFVLHSSYYFLIALPGFAITG